MSPALRTPGDPDTVADSGSPGGCGQPLVKEPVATGIWLRAMSVQFRIAFRQLSTSHRMIEGLQTFQKSACMDSWPPLDRASWEPGISLAAFQRSRMDRAGSPTGWVTGHACRFGYAMCDLWSAL